MLWMEEILHPPYVPYRDPKWCKIPSILGSVFCRKLGCYTLGLVIPRPHESL